MVKRILRRKEVERLVGKRCSTIYSDIADGKFPRPIRIGNKAVGWLEDEIIEWQNARIAERDRRGEAA